MKRAVISITDTCMLRCRHCYNMQNKSNCTADFFNNDFVNQLLSVEIQQIVISGGEPTIEWDLLLSILRKTQNRFSVVITSNGILLNREKTLSLMEMGVSKLQISLDGVSASSHEYLRGKGTYQYAYELIKSFPTFIIPMFTIHARNYHEIGQFIEQQVDNGVKKIGFERYIPINRNPHNNDLALSQQQLLSAYDTISNYSGVEFHINDPLYNTYLFRKNHVPIDVINKFTDIGCQALKNNLYISANGNVYPCVFIDKILFNIHEKPLSYYKDIPFLSIKGCMGCGYYCVCKGCRAAAYYHYGDWLEKDPLCPLQ